MASAKASIRDLRLNFRSVKRQIEEHGSIIITDNGVPSYKIELLPRPKQSQKPLPDYMARLRKQRSKPLNAQQTAALHEENRGDR
jgi:hypothetical protein